MSVVNLVMYCLPSLLLGVLIVRVAADHVAIIQTLNKKFVPGIGFGLALASIHFVLLRNYTAGIGTDLMIDGIDPRLIICTVISGGILILDMDMLINCRFRIKRA